jgi:hypothetical protein
LVFRINQTKQLPRAALGHTSQSSCLPRGLTRWRSPPNDHKLGVRLSEQLVECRTVGWLRGSDAGLVGKAAGGQLGSLPPILG